MMFHLNVRDSKMTFKLTWWNWLW